MSKKFNLDAMSVDEMWHLHEKIIQILSVKLTSEKRELEKRLAKLHRDRQIQMPGAEVEDRRATIKPSGRRKYPQVIPKYQNPDVPSETWSGRGKRPRWLNSAISAGHQIEEFVISEETCGSVRRQRA
jgi:DNA-binding protein H-NS